MDTVTLWRRRRRARALRRMVCIGVAATATYVYWTGTIGVVRDVGRQVLLAFSSHEAKATATAGPETARPRPTAVGAAAGQAAAEATGGESDARCLAHAIYFDGAGQSRETRLAIAQVARNRVNSGDFAHSYCKVVYAGIGRANGCLFVEACRNIGAMPAGEAAWDEAAAVALEVIDGTAAMPAQVALATHFHALDAKPNWHKSLRPLGGIGAFVFYADNTGDTALPVPTAGAAPIVAAPAKPRATAARSSPPSTAPAGAPASSAGLLTNIERTSP